MHTVKLLLHVIELRLRSCQLLQQKGTSLLQIILLRSRLIELPPACVALCSQVLLAQARLAQIALQPGHLAFQGRQSPEIIDPTPESLDFAVALCGDAVALHKVCICPLGRVSGVLALPLQDSDAV